MRSQVALTRSNKNVELTLDAKPSKHSNAMKKVLINFKAREIHSERFSLITIEVTIEEGAKNVEIMTTRHGFVIFCIDAKDVSDNSTIDKNYVNSRNVVYASLHERHCVNVQLKFNTEGSWNLLCLYPTE